MKISMLLIIIAFVCLLNFSCSTKSNLLVASDQKWLDEDRIKRTISREYNDPPTDKFSLQRKADVLLELLDQENLEMLATKVDGKFPEGEFPISDLSKYFPPGGQRKTIRLVVVVVRGYFPLEINKPALLEIIPKMDRVFAQNGVQRRVFEDIEGPRYFKLDSADAE
jgi:hypothetical protein